MNASFLRKTLCALLGSCVLATTVPAADDSAELENVRATVSEMFEGIEADDIFASEVDGWYTVRKGAIIAYVSSDGRYLMQGDIIDLEESVNLSEESRNDARAKMMSAVPEDELITYTPETVRHTVNIFTDIDCTFCRRLHSQLDEYMDEGIEIRYFLYPRNGPTSESWVKAENVWCADDRNEALTKAKLDQGFAKRDCDASVVSSHYAIGQDVGLRGTPAIVLEDGTLFSGYLPAKQLSEAIASSRD
ncbi:MAG: DsbC family protein [Woeseiaceae bacterium]|jgi:thiol:disulfide interchange protein DsbC|nr:DsbC family protein [Woeseiaceae bacterium]